MGSLINKTISDKMIYKVTEIIAFFMLSLSVFCIIIALAEAISNTVNCCCICNYIFSFEGVRIFFSYFTQYGWVFGGTFIVFASKYALERVITAEKTHSFSEKLSIKTHWYNYLKQDVLDRKKADNETLYKFIVQHLNKIFDFIYEQDCEFKSKEQIKNFFSEFIGEAVIIFEQNNAEYKAKKGIYPDNDFAYARNDFFEILEAIAPATKSYNESMLTDFIEIYNEHLNEYMKFREINPEEFNTLP